MRQALNYRQVHTVFQSEVRRESSNRRYVEVLVLDGRKLRQHRVRTGVSTEEIALATHRTVSSVFKWETNRANPPASVVRTIAQVLGVSTEALCYPPHLAADAEQEKQALDEYITGVVARAGDLTTEQRVRLAQLLPAELTSRTGTAAAA